MTTKKVLLQVSRIVLIVFIFSSTVFSQTVESISDTASVKPLFQKKILLTVKAGTVLLPSGAAGLKAGIAFSASMSFYLGKNFYLNPVFSFWNSDYKAKYSNEIKNISVTGFFGEVEYILSFDKLSFPVGLGIGSCAAGGDGILGLLFAAGSLYQLKDGLNFYFGASYQPCAAIDLGGGGYSYAPGMIYTGISYRIK